MIARGSSRVSSGSLLIGLFTGGALCVVLWTAAPASAEPAPPPPPEAAEEVPAPGQIPAPPRVPAQDGVYDFDDPHQNIVSFQVRAPLFPPLPPIPLRKIRGVSNSVEGAVRVAGGYASGDFRIPISSFKTGSAWRDRRMTSKRMLDAERYPFVRFRFHGLKVPPARYSGEPFEVTVDGTFTLHGVTRPARVPLLVTYLREAGGPDGAATGGLLRVRGQLRVNLADHFVRRPGFLFWRVSRSAFVELDLHGQKVAPAPAVAGLELGRTTAALQRR